MKRKYFIIEFIALLWAAKNMILFFLIMVAGGAAVFHHEGLKNSSGNWEDSIYASLTTALTIGYGDLTPIGLYGRIAAVLLGLTGMLFVGVVVGASIKALERSR